MAREGNRVGLGTLERRRNSHNSASGPEHCPAKSSGNASGCTKKAKQFDPSVPDFSPKCKTLAEDDLRAEANCNCSSGRKLAFFTDYKEGLWKAF